MKGWQVLPGRLTSVSGPSLGRRRNGLALALAHQLLDISAVFGDGRTRLVECHQKFAPVFAGLGNVVLLYAIFGSHDFARVSHHGETWLILKQSAKLRSGRFSEPTGQKDRDSEAVRHRSSPVRQDPHTVQPILAPPLKPVIVSSVSREQIDAATAQLRSLTRDRHQPIFDTGLALCRLGLSSTEVEAELVFAVGSDPGCAERSRPQ